MGAGVVELVVDEVGASVSSLVGPPHNLRPKLQQLGRYWQETPGSYVNIKLKLADDRFGTKFSEQLSDSVRQGLEALLLQALDLDRPTGVFTQHSPETESATQRKAKAVEAAAAALDLRETLQDATKTRAEADKAAAAATAAWLGV